MKKALLFTLLLSFSVKILCQDTTQSLRLKEYYLQKSKRQNKTGHILLGVGIGATVLGAGLALSGYGAENSSSALGYVGAGLFVGGVISMLTSPVFFISAKSNKKHAAEIAVINQNIFFPRQNIVSTRSIPALRFTIALK